METKAHTVKRFDAELEELNNNVVQMASAVEEQLGRLGDALVNLNADEAAKVMAEDHVINSWEAELDDYLETIISRRQPQAVDLRLLLGYYRMTTDFELHGRRKSAMPPRVSASSASSSSLCLSPLWPMFRRSLVCTRSCA